MLFLLILFSPVVVAVLELVAYAVLVLRRRNPDSILVLAGMSAEYAVYGAMASLALLVAWMFVSRELTGIDPGNAPAAWIFGLGPLSAACGQLVALAHWWPREPKEA